MKIVLIILFVVAVILVVFIVWAKYQDLREKYLKSKKHIQEETKSTTVGAFGDKLVGELAYTNLTSGSIVPVSGYYDCLLCGPGGVIDITMKNMLCKTEAQRRAASRITARRFSSG
jgi:hypothetical protein